MGYGLTTSEMAPSSLLPWPLAACAAVAGQAEGHLDQFAAADLDRARPPPPSVYA